MEPRTLLRRGEADASEVRLEKLAHKTAGRVVRLQEDNEPGSRQEESRGEDGGRRPEADGFTEGVEGGGGEDEAADEGHKGEGVDG